jgi:phage-related protein
MSKLTYSEFVGGGDKPLRWLHGEVKTPPFSRTALLEAGLLLRRLQQGETLSLPHSRPMPSLGPRCQELRVRDQNKNWRIVYRMDEDRILIVEVFQKTTRQTPDAVTCDGVYKRSDGAKPRDLMALKT